MTLEVKKVLPAFTDDRGDIVDVITDKTITHVGRITFTSGSIRAKHFHKKSNQYNYVLSGKIELTVKNLKDNSDIEIISLEPNDLILVPPYWYHSLKSTSNAELMIFTTSPRNDGGYEDDTFRVTDIQNFSLKK
jgi:oxalate decarboxylase/phosphoglucose isomerase-like protein (cupin superfamily)